MSAFLGPIHYWLYNKIKLQHNMVETIIKYAEDKNLIKDLRSQLDEQYGTIDLRPLEQQIDTSNIHGWLQECVSTVEYRLAYAVTALLKLDSNVMGDLKETFKNLGVTESTLDNNTTVEEAYKALNDTLLDGMPCDHANSLVSQSESEVVWKRNVCVHERYWSELNGDIKNYYILREEYIQGFLSKAGIQFKKQDETTSVITKQ